MGILCRSGAESEEAHQAMELNDRMLNYLLDTLDGLGIEQTTNIIVMGDHGMTNHHSDQVAYLSDYGVHMGDLMWYTNNLFTTGMLIPHSNLIDSVSSASYIYI